MLPNVGPLEIMVVLAIALIVFGPKRIPELGKSLGHGIREFKGSLSSDDDGDDDEEETKPAIEAAKNGTGEPVEGELVINARG